MPSASTTARIAALLPLAPRDYLILFALVDGPRHGHGMLKRIETESRGVLLDPANLYRSLRKLEREELVAEARDPGTVTEGPARRFYKLTKLGRDVLAAEAERLAHLTDAARARKLLPAWRGPR
ncbi:MAG TPA: helix-turn-helix transcriptional regulator [Vicinamibacterales bacterium]|nr:helix-turn-helix transcriptional regulator [Vicinamibacterales bacterium]